MNLYTLSQDEATGYDTYSNCVVAAESEEAARLIRPDGYDWSKPGEWDYSGNAWARKPENVKVELLGIAIDGTKAGVVCSSFHAG